MYFQKEYLDILLVPSGLLILFAYHLYLLYRILHLPLKTSIGFMNTDTRIWVERIMQAEKSELNMALSVISTNISAATFLASVCLTLSSIIGAWLGSSSSGDVFHSDLVYGDTRAETISIKYICLLFFFLVSFSCFIQSARCFVHANYLITTPGNDIPVEIVKKTVIEGGDFWSIGLRSLYFALNILLWFFGPIPMFVSAIVMVIVLHFVDSNSTVSPLHHQRFSGGQMMNKKIGA